MEVNGYVPCSSADVTTSDTVASSTSAVTTTSSVKHSNSPQTGVAGVEIAESVFGISAIILFFSRSKNKKAK